MKVFTLVLVTTISIRIFIQDFKSRTIDIFSLAGLAVSVVLFHFYVRPIDFLEASFSLAYLTLVLVMGALVLRLMFKKDLRGALGTGDFLFFVPTVFFFDFPSYLIWFNVSILLTLILHLLISKISGKPDQKKLIPLAGYLAVLLIIAIVFESYYERIGTIIF